MKIFSPKPDDRAGNVDRARTTCMLRLLTRIMHPQLDDLRIAIHRFLENTTSSLEVYCPDCRLSVQFYFSHVLSRPKRALFGQTRAVPCLRAPAASNEKAMRIAQAMGFLHGSRVTCSPHGQKVNIPIIEAQFCSADEGADWCLAALQDIHGTGEAWLWITDQAYSEWPDPLPQPSVWPPTDRK